MDGELSARTVWIVTNLFHEIRPSGQPQNGCSKSFPTILSAAAPAIASDEGMPVFFTGTTYSGCLFVWLLYFAKSSTWAK